MFNLLGSFSLIASFSAASGTRQQCSLLTTWCQDDVVNVSSTYAIATLIWWVLQRWKRIPVREDWMMKVSSLMKAFCTYNVSDCNSPRQRSSTTLQPSSIPHQSKQRLIVVQLQDSLCKWRIRQPWQPWRQSDRPIAATGRRLSMAQQWWCRCYTENHCTYFPFSSRRADTKYMRLLLRLIVIAPTIVGHF